MQEAASELSQTDFASMIALASSMVGLAYAIVHGPLRNIGWMNAARRELELSEMLTGDGPEEEARRFLRERAAYRVLKSRDFSESISYRSVRFLHAVSIVGMVATIVLGLVVTVSNLLGISSSPMMALYVATIIVMSVGSIGSVVALSLLKRRTKRQKMMMNTLYAEYSTVKQTENPTKKRPMKSSSSSISAP